MSQDTKMSEYARVFEELSHMDRLLMRGRQLVIQPKLQFRVIKAAHKGHMKEMKTIGTRGRTISGSRAKEQVT